MHWLFDDLRMGHPMRWFLPPPPLPSFMFPELHSPFHAFFDRFHPGMDRAVRSACALTAWQVSLVRLVAGVLRRERSRFLQLPRQPTDARAGRVGETDTNAEDLPSGIPDDDVLGQGRLRTSVRRSTSIGQYARGDEVPAQKPNTQLGNARRCTSTSLDTSIAQHSRVYAYV